MSESIEMMWDSESRLALIRLESETCATGKGAVVFVDALTRLKAFADEGEACAWLRAIGIAA